MEILSPEMAALGALGIVGLLAVLRIFRKGRGSYAQHREALEGRIRKTAAEIREQAMAIPVREQLDVLAAALDEVLRLAGNPPDCAVERQSAALCLRTPAGVWRMGYQPRSASLRGQKRILHGSGQWQVREPDGSSATFSELADLVRHVDAQVRHRNAICVFMEKIPPLQHRRGKRQ